MTFCQVQIHLFFGACTGHLFFLLIIRMRSPLPLVNKRAWMNPFGQRHFIVKGKRGLSTSPHANVSGILEKSSSTLFQTHPISPFRESWTVVLFKNLIIPNLFSMQPALLMQGNSIWGDLRGAFGFFQKLNAHKKLMLNQLRDTVQVSRINPLVFGFIF